MELPAENVLGEKLSFSGSGHYSNTLGFFFFFFFFNIVKSGWLAG